MRLNETQRKQLFLDDRSGSFTISQLCEKYSVSRTTVNNVRKSFVLENDDQSGNESEGGASSSSHSTSSSSSHSSIASGTERYSRDIPPYLDMTDTQEPEPQAQQAPPQAQQAPPPAQPQWVPEPEPQWTPPQTQEPAAYDVTKDRLFLQDKIRAFVTSFSHKLHGITGETELARERWVAGLKDLQAEQLESILEAIKYKIAQGGVTDMTFTMFTSATMAIEYTGPYVGLRLNGFSDSLSKNDQAKEALMEIVCDRMSSVVFSPEKRLAMIMLSTMYNCHTMNQMTDNASELMRQPAPSTPTEAFE